MSFALLRGSLPPPPPFDSPSMIEQAEHEAKTPAPTRSTLMMPPNSDASGGSGMQSSLGNAEEPAAKKKRLQRTHGGKQVCDIYYEGGTLPWCNGTGDLMKMGWIGLPY